MIEASPRSRASMKYKRNHLKRIQLRFQKSYFIDELEPMAKALGEPPITFIKRAVIERIESEGKTPPLDMPYQINGLV